MTACKWRYYNRSLCETQNGLEWELEGFFRVVGETAQTVTLEIHYPIRIIDDEFVVPITFKKEREMK